MRLVLPVAFTIIYVITIAGSLFETGQELRALQLNELGDFLAGILGPIALVWLVTGIFLQSYEMRLNTTELSRSRIVAEEALDVARETNSIKNSEMRRRVRSGYTEYFVYIDHDDAGLLRPPYKSEYDDKRTLGIWYAAISRRQVVFRVRNFGVSGNLAKIYVNNWRPPEVPFHVKFVPSFDMHSLGEYRPEYKIGSGSRYFMIFVFDASLEPRLGNDEEVDFEGNIWLIFDIQEKDGSIRKVSQEVEYSFKFDQGQAGEAWLLGIPNDSILQFHPTSDGEYNHHD